MRKLAEHFNDTVPGRNLRSRVMNALWREFYPRRLRKDRPDDWEPEPDDVSAIFLGLVHGLGPKGNAVVQAWLKERREAPK